MADSVDNASRSTLVEMARRGDLEPAVFWAFLSRSRGDVTLRTALLCRTHLSAEMIDVGLDHPELGVQVTVARHVDATDEQRNLVRWRRKGWTVAGARAVIVRHGDRDPVPDATTLSARVHLAGTGLTPGEAFASDTGVQRVA